jgi:hypothetical protein
MAPSALHGWLLDHQGLQTLTLHLQNGGHAFLLM